MISRHSGREGFGVGALALSLGAGALLFSSCSKETSPGDNSAQPSAVSSQSNSSQATQPAAALDTSSAELGSATSAAVAATAPDCKNPADWETQTVAALKDGAIQLPKADKKLAPLAWAPCSEGQTHCERPVLAPGASVLAVGALGNRMRLAIKDSCEGGEETVTVASVEGEPDLALRGESFVFEMAALGGDRLLLGGFAKHASEKSKEGYAKREYLLTRREYGDKKFEAARNKQLFAPHSASSQLVHVRGATQCTGLFWKIGVEQCSFAGPGTDVFALFGGHLIYSDPATSKGMGWDAKQGPRVLFEQLDWVVTEGINVAWSSNGKLYTTQPRWDLPELTATPAPGAAGAKPLAFGCGRLLRPNGAAWELRDIQKGIVWTLEGERFPAGAAESPSSPTMNCDYVLFPSGERVSLKSLGAPVPLPADGAPTQSTALSPEAPPGPSAAPPANAPSATSPAVPGASPPPATSAREGVAP